MIGFGKDENEGNKYDGYFFDLNGYRDIFIEKKIIGKWIYLWEWEGEGGVL